MSPHDDEPEWRHAVPVHAGSLRIATWNVEWAKPGTARGERVRSLLSDQAADVLVVTEGYAELLPDGGHVIDAGTDWGYRSEVGRRKVLAWSRSPWTDVETIDVGASCGRIVLGRTRTPLGVVHVLSVCIPWRDAHVRTGRCDAQLWSEHLECCEALAERAVEPRTVMAGDFNQRLPRHMQPIAVAGALDRVLAPFTLWTGGDTESGRLVDHIATTRDLRADRVSTWTGISNDGYLSDHAGVAIDVSAG